MYAWRDGSYTRELGGQINVLFGFKIFCFVYYFPFSNFSVLGTEMVKNIGDKDNFSFDSATKI